MKQCYVCKQEKPLAKFPLRKKGQRRARCVECRIAESLGPKRDQLEKRFWSKVDKTNDCWFWTAARTNKGYGTFLFGGFSCNAQRVAYMLMYGPIPEYMYICHKCDNPPCVNPDHLFLGTHADNMIDKVAKGRQRSGRWLALHPERAARGERNGAAKLTEDQVREIRKMYIAGFKISQIVEQYEVCYNTIDNVVKNRKWKHVTID